jgi:hypothetical protein
MSGADPSKMSLWHMDWKQLSDGRWWIAAIWLLWIVAANFLIYPVIEQGIASLYLLAGEGSGLPVFLATVIVWTYAFVWKGERIGAV